MLIVIRHGQAENNISKVYNSNPASPGYKPLNLTPQGIQQIKKTAVELLAKGYNDSNIAAVFVSPMPRAKQTAEECVQSGLFSEKKIIIDPRITELQAGDLEGKPVLPVWSRAIAQINHAETEDQVKERVNSFYQQLLHQFPQGNIVVITHGFPGEILIQVAAHKDVKLQVGEAQIIPLRG
jgi:broad specificity phosphatase PhoE